MPTLAYYTSATTRRIRGKTTVKGLSVSTPKMLQGKFKKVKAAKKVLLDALGSDTADQFRAKVLACLKSSTETYVPVLVFVGL